MGDTLSTSSSSFHWSPRQLESLESKRCELGETRYVLQAQERDLGGEGSELAQEPCQVVDSRCQEEISGDENIIDILEYSNKKRIQQLQSELQEWEDKEESKINCLELQVEQLNAKVEKTQEEVNFLSTYMDHEYPVRSVQIANLARQLQQAKDDQQDELDNLAEMRRMVLELLSTKIWKKKEKILRSLAMRTLQPHEEALLQKTQDSQHRRRCRGTVTEFIDELKGRLPELKAEVEELRAQRQEPREVVFKDVLLRRPKCTPDMDVVLNLPEEELLF